MFGFIIRRLLQILPTVFIAISFLFLLFFVLPGDPANLIVGGGNRTVDPGVIERAKERYGLDDPLWVQFKDYWARLLQWDLGESFANRRSVNSILYERAAAQHPARLLGGAHRDRRRDHRRADLGGQALLAHRQGDDARHHRRRSDSRVRARLRPAVRVRRHPEQVRLAGVDGAAHLRPRARYVGAVLHSDRRAVALPDPSGGHPGGRVDGLGGTDDARLDARRAATPTTSARHGRRASASARSSCGTVCATP